MRSAQSFCIAVFVIFAFAFPARALVINPTFDSSITSLPNAASLESAFTYAAGQYESRFSDPMSINVTVSANPTLSGGESIVALDNYDYAPVYNALVADAKSASDQTLLSNLSATAPFGGIFKMTPGEEKALGLLPGDRPDNDGQIVFGTEYPDTYDPAHRAVPGEADFIGVAEHEISEVMGRVADVNLAGFYEPLDLMRFSAPGQRSLDASAPGAYFSIDDGVTKLNTFSSWDGSGADLADWVGPLPDAFNAFVGTGVVNDLSPADLTEMDVLGYDPVPEPAGLPLLACSLLLLARRRRAGRSAQDVV